MTLRITLSFVFLLLCFSLQAQPSLELQLFASGFDEPVDITHAGDDRIFVVEKDGRIRILRPDGSIDPVPFLNITGPVGSGGFEEGLLGLVFHPDYTDNGYFYVNYTGTDGDTRIARFERDPLDPDRALPSSEQILLTVSQPFNNHNAGDLAFGPDGYLYIPLGDGGSGGDPGNRSQNPLTLLGKMLRIDVDGGDPYAIPPDNPFVNDNSTLDEIWALGLRNPWRISFDRQTGDLWIADVGQSDYEEVNFQQAGSAGGQNYGWRCYEGNAPFNLNGCGSIGNYTFPAAEYPHVGSFCGGSITGGFVYRGPSDPPLQGLYIYADYCQNVFYTLGPDGMGGWEQNEALTFPGFEAVTFGEDVDGELYAARLGEGQIYRVRSATCADLESDLEISYTDSLRVSDQYEDYQWFLNGQPLSGATGPALAPNEVGLYSVQLTDTGTGCILSASFLVNVVGTELPSWVTSFTVYPNPASGRAEVSFSAARARQYNMHLRDVSGKLLQQWPAGWAGEGPLSLDLSGLPAGLYFVQVKGPQGTAVRKLVKH